MVRVTGQELRASDVVSLRAVLGRLTTAVCLSLATAGLVTSGCYSDKDGEAGRDNEGSAGSVAAGGQGPEGGAAGNNGNAEAGASGSAGGSDEPGATSACPEAVAEPLPARLAILSEDAPDPGSTDQVLTLTKASLFRDFERQGCGVAGCHGGADLPLAVSPDAFKLTLRSFDQRPDLGSAALARVLTSDPLKVMPPGSGDGSTRDAGHPLRRLAERLLAWETAGFPESFQMTIAGEPSTPSTTDPYLLSPGLGAKLTNIGNCLPSRAMLVDRPRAMLDELEALDARFAVLASSDELPDTLAETDLVSLDSAVLARKNVFNYAPTYTLFSDNAGKLRHVRVPVGDVIRYNPNTKDFDIPDNTRFYKTFMRPVRDADGKVGYRKMETRLIVVRRDDSLPGGGYRTRALRAAYAWDKDERMARRVKDPFRNGRPAADRLCPVIVDESVARDPQKNPISDEISEFCQYMTEEERADPASGRVRHYAIPSTERCDQCHMGSNNHSYVLGFNPWQVDRRPKGQGGIYEDPTEDELGQLARLIEYGVIEGIEPGVAKLEESQGERKPRNEFELKAQAYMMGNCVFCHSANGFPVVQNPVLKPFELYPSETGGIFQFDLERYSPRVLAGPITNNSGGSISARFPYISPSFGAHLLGRESEVKTANLDFSPVIDGLDNAPDFDRNNDKFTFLGPWRSLIWRNVYTPFTYTEDKAIFVHMPRNVPGYDCRAQKIMAEWMLSIPTLQKRVTTDKDDPATRERNENREDQPVHEVFAHEPVYRQAVAAAQTRIEHFQRGATGAHCPDDADIVDPKIVLSPIDFATKRKSRSSPQDEGILNSPRVVAKAQSQLRDQVPDHAHWVPTDTTDAPGKWVPRRSNWADILVERRVDVPEKLDDVIAALQSVHLSPALESFALEPLPMGPWHADCQTRAEAAHSPTSEELQREPLQPFRRWLAGGVLERDTPVTGNARIHFQSRGEAVFRAICQNCHGKDADSKSPLAATILELTGGQTRVANFLGGLFGPRSRPGAFARDEFLVNRGATPEDWQARYVLFMGLGGTEAELPQAVVDLVATSPFYGQSFTAPGKRGDPNMLDSAVQICREISLYERELSIQVTGVVGRRSFPEVIVMRSPFVKGVAHYDLWQSLCWFENEPIVTVFGAPSAFDPRTQPQPPKSRGGLGGAFRAKNDAGGWVYPAGHLVGGPRGIEAGIQPWNDSPWCVRVASEAERHQTLVWAAEFGLAPERVPFCPEALFARAFGVPIHQIQTNSDVPFGNKEFAEGWARRGAMNAGLAAFYYLRGVTGGQITPSLPFDFCRE